MNETQQILFDMYKSVSKILDEEKIPFYFMYGSTLGAIRHNGFIPWDDDIDIAIFEKDLPHANKALKERLDPEMYYYHIPTADSHPHIIFKSDDFEESLKNKKSVFMDIFILCEYPSPGMRRRLFNFFIRLNYLSIYAIDHIGWLPLHRALSWIPNAAKRISEKIDCKDSGKCVVFSTTFKMDRYNVDDYGEPIMHIFETEMVPIPQKWEKLMIQYYGYDYMTPPPENERGGAQGFPASVYKDYILEKKKEH